jgi:hypothetical protein
VGLRVAERVASVTAEVGNNTEEVFPPALADSLAQDNPLDLPVPRDIPQVALVALPDSPPVVVEVYTAVAVVGYIEVVAAVEVAVTAE